MLKRHDMQINLSTAFHLMILLTILMLLLHNNRRRFAQTISQRPCLRRRRAEPKNQGRAKNHAKPGWVKTEVLRLLALMREAGVRTIASTFNAKFASKGESVSKTYVAQLKKKARYEWMRLRKDFRKPPVISPTTTAQRVVFLRI